MGSRFALPQISVMRKLVNRTVIVCNWHSHAFTIGTLLYSFIGEYSTPRHYFALTAAKYKRIVRWCIIFLISEAYDRINVRTKNVLSIAYIIILSNIQYIEFNVKTLIVKCWYIYIYVVVWCSILIYRFLFCLIALICINNFLSYNRTCDRTNKF